MVTNEFISYFCFEMSLLFHAGITAEDALYLIAKNKKSKDAEEVLEMLIKNIEESMSLSEAMRKTLEFPDYVCDMVETGEKTGRTEQAFRSLAEHYDERVKLGKLIKNALLYPSLLLVLMIGIILLLLVKVLPVFDKVYSQLGEKMKGSAAVLLSIGEKLNQCLPFICICLGIAVFLIALIIKLPYFREKCICFYNRTLGNYGIGKKIRTARLAQTMAMGMLSGLHTEEAFGLAAMHYRDVKHAEKSYEQCRGLLEEGIELPEAMKETCLMDEFYCNILELGIKSGSTDAAILEIAKRLDEEVQDSIYQKVGKIEPTIVIIASVLVGMILLVVMLPLLNIMSSIG